MTEMKCECGHHDDDHGKCRVAGCSCGGFSTVSIPVKEAPRELLRDVRSVLVSLYNAIQESPATPEMKRYAKLIARIEHFVAPAASAGGGTSEAPPERTP